MAFTVRWRMMELTGSLISQASTIRNVIETLAGVEPQSISENTSIFEVGLDSIDATDKLGQ
jgi:hypothetical protein